MTKKDKYLDEMLEGLDGYKPSVEPDWDAFYQKNKESISVKKSKGIVSKTVVRLTLLVITIAAVFTGGYFYMQSASTTEDISSEEKTEIPVLENEINNDLQIVNPATTAPDQHIEIIPQSTSPVDNSNAGGIGTIISDPVVVPGQTVIPGSAPEAGKPIINETKTTIAPVQKDSEVDKPVIIKQTVIIKDTIRVTQPIKKEK